MESLRDMIKKNQTAAIALVVVAVLFIIYNTFIRSEEGPDLISESQGIRNLEIGREIIVTLNRLKDIQIDTGILEDPRFEKLQDFSQPLPEYLEGKNNPFEVEVAGTIIRSQEVIEVIPETPTGEASVDASNVN